MYEIQPIGFFHAAQSEKYAVSRQPLITDKNSGKIVLNPHCHFEEALKDLNGFDRIFVIYRFHKNATWKPKVMPPRGDKKRGVFATRSPHRPNFLGLSCLQLIKVEGLTLYVSNHDLLDGTPIFDIKPYIPYADAFPEANSGWLKELENAISYEIIWKELAEIKREYLKNEWNVDIELNIASRLKANPFPAKQNRIKKMGNFYEIAFKTWRVKFSVDDANVVIEDIYSGYDLDTLSGVKPCRYNDLDCHRKFCNNF